jgi:hypothetical protein
VSRALPQRPGRRRGRAVPSADIGERFGGRSAKVVDLTAKMTKGGRLDWDVPAGKWSVLRMGYSLTGQKNGPAPPEARRSAYQRARWGRARE